MMDYLHSTETDIAYHLLTEKGEPIHFKALIMDVIEKKAKPVQSLSHAISEIYTLINMDSRFQHRGHGDWGLTEWYPPEPKRSHSSSASSQSAASSAPAEPAEPTLSAAEVKANRRREKAFESIQEE